MAVALSGTGGFFTRAGAAIAGVNEITALLGSTTNSRLATIAAEYASNEQADFASAWTQRDSFRSTPAGYLQWLFDLVANTLVDQVDRDTVLPSREVTTALTELIRQMKATSDSLNRPSLGQTVTAGSGNTGDTTIKISTLDGDGLPLDCLFAETLLATVTSDKGSGSTEFSEPISIRGDLAASPTAFDWPLGSGSSTTLTTIDPAVDGLLSNGNFETWTVTNVPDDWTIATGVAGTHVTRQASPARSTDSYNLRLTSDGSTLVTLRQAPSTTLLPLTVYAATITAKISATDATGALRFALVDGSGTVINDAQSVANSSSLGLNGGSGLSTSYTQFTVYFRTPAKIPATVNFELKLTTSPTTGRTIDIDLVQLARPTQLYSGGPFAVAWANVTSPVKGDYWTIAMTNDLTTTSLVRSLDRMLSTRALGLKFPTATSETVPDSLVA